MPSLLTNLFFSVDYKISKYLCWKICKAQKCEKKFVSLISPPRDNNYYCDVMYLHEVEGPNICYILV